MVGCGVVRDRRWNDLPPDVTPNRPLAVRRGAATMRAMEVITPPRMVERPSFLPVVGGTVVATLLIVAGVVLAWAALATPILSSVMPRGRADTGQMIVGMAAWAVALVAPPVLLLVGARRRARILGRTRDRMPRRSAVMRALTDPPEDVVIAHGLTLPDGRGVADLIVGPFGAAVVRELPSPEVTRVRNGHWELRTGRGWMPMENPLDRATRDAERVRRWLAHDEADFVVKTYAAVIGTAPTVARTTACAVLTPEQLPSWVAALPAQRSLTPGRREQLLDTVRDAAR